MLYMKKNVAFADPKQSTRMCASGAETPSPVREESISLCFCFPTGGGWCSADGMPDQAWHDDQDRS